MIKKKKPWKFLVPGGVLLAAAFLNLTGWLSPSFCDFYAENIFPLWVETYGRLTGLFPFSVGEWMVYLAAALVLILLLFGIVYGLFRSLLPTALKKAYRAFALGMLWIFCAVCMIMTLNCLLVYHVSPISERYRIGAGSRTEYGAEELRRLRNMVVTKANELAPLLERDEDGFLIYEGNMEEEAKKRMRALGEEYGSLKGYYPDPKPLYFSGFFSQQYIMGYYFPFSMEANYNDMMYVVNMPVTMCHELSHLKGFILEDEANFIGYLACAGSEDPFFRYSAYLSVLNYLDRDFFQSVHKDMAVYLQNPSISPQVLSDKLFLTEEKWEQVEEKAVIDTELVKEASDKFVEANLTLNGVKDGKVSYSRVVDLLLKYYDGILY